MELMCVQVENFDARLKQELEAQAQKAGREANKRAQGTQGARGPNG